MNADEALTALLTAADGLFYTRGVGDVSMAEIRDHSGLSMRRVYSLSPSKADLVALWLEHRHVTWNRGLRDEITAITASGTSAVDAIFQALAAWMTATNFRGCGFINTHAEASGLTDRHRAIIRTHKQDFARYLDDLVGNGAALAVLLDGAIVQASIFADTAPITAAHEAAQTLLAATNPHATTTTTSNTGRNTR